MNKTAEYLIYLDACALNGAKPDLALMPELNLGALYRFARAQTLTAITCMALESAGALAGAEAETAKKWTDAKNMAIRKNMLLDAERGEISRELDAAEIWYMPLKGSVIKDLYPAFGMRQMADCDMLFDPERRGDVKGIMRARGYSVTVYGASNHDVYKKPPVYNFEMHIGLFNESSGMEWVEYFRNIRDRLIPDENGGLKMTDSDLYIYVMVHGFKHRRGAGTGLRTLMDCFVMNRTLTLDREYICAELTKLGAAEFEETARKLSAKLFSEAKLPELTETEAAELAFFIENNTYGTTENVVRNRVNKFAGDGELTVSRRIQYLLSRVFVSRKWCADKYPRVYRWPILLPGLWVYRFVRLITRKRGLLRAELKVVRDSK